jgi:hypothetical protein
LPIRAPGTPISSGLGIAILKVNPDPVMVATEGALWGSIKAHGFLPYTVIVSDDAGQFKLGQHGLCWVHTERLIHKLETFADENRAAQASVRELIWNLYRDLKAYRCAPSRQRKPALRARFDRIFMRKTGFVTLDRLLARLHANKSELLMVLDRPEIPLHTNWIGERHPLPCDQAQGQRRHPQRCRTRLSRRPPRHPQDLRQARNHLLGLSRFKTGGPGSLLHPIPARTGPRAIPAALTAADFAPLTAFDK